MERKTVKIDLTDRVATITMNRPDKRNAISYEMIADLESALQELAETSAQVVILTGAGKAFCSGMDLENLRQITGQTPEENLADSETMARLFLAVYRFPKPTIAAVNGPAIAGGCAIATLCDFTLAAEEARFGYTEVRIGFVPAIVSTFLVWQIGDKRARDLLLSGRIFGPEEAMRLGIVNEVAPQAELRERAHALAGELMQNSPSSLAATKSLLLGYVNEALERQLRQAVLSNARIRTTEDFREGLAAFLAKRAPKWSGR